MKALQFQGVGEPLHLADVPRPAAEPGGLVFKVKGEKHSETHVKTLAAVDVEKIANVRLLVDTLVTQHRLEKKLDDLKEQGLEVDIKNTGQFLKLVTGDVMKEEADTISASGLPQTDVMRGVSMRAKQFFMETAHVISL